MQKAPEPGPAAVAAKPGVVQLVLEDHFAPPDASADCQCHGTGCHAISGVQWPARFGDFSDDDVDDLEETTQDKKWYDVSHPSVAQPQDGM